MKESNNNGAKKYDVFIFYNELDLLEIRLNILYEHIDFFIIVESNRTFTGKNKPLYYKENEDRFIKFRDKILYHVVDDLPDTFEEVQERLAKSDNPIETEILKNCLTTSQIPKDNSQVQWLREFYQKESMKSALSKYDPSDFDICYISDIDEIWNPETNATPSGDDVLKFEQIVYSMYMNLRSNEYWAGTYAALYSRIKNSSLNHLDNPGLTKVSFISDGGWHFTFQGGVDMIINKIENYGHQELNNSYIKNGIEENYKNGRDLLNRSNNYHIDNISLPPYIIENIDLYSKYLKY
jgi:beta-1,4-mannosyl-glycoprotein beta-1,4-N-acetylglucosaminyltransferase